MKSCFTHARKTLGAFGILAGLALTTALGDSWPMPPKVPFDSNPQQQNSPTNKILTYGTDPAGNLVPTKTIRITNNSDKTVFPFLRDPNSTLTKNGKLGLYDPYDLPNKEYRGYAGYEQGGAYFFGLQPGQSITMEIPLVFWNGGRICVATDGTYLTPAGNPNPLGYDPNAKKIITSAVHSPDSISNGVVMWYCADTAVGPTADSVQQLAELTIRDHRYLVNPAITAKTNGEIPDSQLVTLANYDVSFVDSLYMPLAFEALDAWVIPQSAGTGPHANRDGWKPGSDPDKFGWTGAVDTMEQLQSKIREFTASPSSNPLPHTSGTAPAGLMNPYLGNYFGGKGWPFYNIPNPTNDPRQPIKIPSGANLFPNSPLLGTASSYNNPASWQSNKYMLSSGGTSAISVTIPNSGSVTNPVGSQTLNLNNLDPDKTLMPFVQIGQSVVGNVPPHAKNPIQPGTTVTKVDHDAWTVELSKPLQAPSAAASYTFTRPVDDYAADAIVRLWFSWAQYYLDHWNEKNPQAPTGPKTVKGSMQVQGATIRFNEAHPELVEGMTVTGPGLNSAQTEVGPHLGNALILQIASDKKSVIVSQVADKSTSKASYTFSQPQRLYWAPKKPGDTGYPLLHFTFTSTQAWREPYEFAQTVYLVMASMNQIGKPNNSTICKFMEDIIGANMGYIFNPNYIDSPEVQMVIAMIRDKIKSALRGVSDFTEFPDVVENGKHVHWYPDPAEHTGGQTFNVFNLDPFVWFVHVKLGFSGYGFSVDDDTSDIGAGGAGRMQLSITGTGGLANTTEWTVQAPYGPVANVECHYSGTAHGDTLYNTIANVSDTTPVKITTSGQNNLQNGQTIEISQVNGSGIAGPYKIGDVSPDSFSLFDLATGAPVAPTGKYNPNPTPGRWSYPPHPYIDTTRSGNLTKVFYRVTGDDPEGTFQGTPVILNGLATKAGERIRVWALGQESTGRLLLNAPFLNADGSPLPEGTYSFTFSGSYNSH